MTAAVVVLALGLVAAVAVLGWHTRSMVLRRRTRSRVLLTLKSGAAFDGVLVETDRTAWVLRDVVALASNARPVPVDGELIVLVADIDYAQRP